MNNLKIKNNISDKKNSTNNNVVKTQSFSKIVNKSNTNEEKVLQTEIRLDQQAKKKELTKRKILWRKTSFRKKRKQSEFKFKIIEVKRITKVTKGGRRFRFMVIALAGNGKGKVGLGYGKSNEVSIARNKAFARAEKNIFSIPLWNDSIPHDIISKFCSSKILLKPAPKGTGIILGGSARIVAEISGIKNIRGKALGSRNKMNLVQATLKALRELRTPKQIMELRSDDE